MILNRNKDFSICSYSSAGDDSGHRDSCCICNPLLPQLPCFEQWKRSHGRRRCVHKYYELKFVISLVVTHDIMIGACLLFTEKKNYIRINP